MRKKRMNEQRMNEGEKEKEDGWNYRREEFWINGSRERMKEQLKSGRKKWKDAERGKEGTNTRRHREGKE